MSDEEIVKQKWPDAEISWGKYGATVLRPITPRPSQWWKAQYEALSVTKTLASEAWADAARSLRPTEADSQESTE